MGGFLAPDLRDYITILGICLAVFQTWLAIKALRGSRIASMNRPVPKPGKVMASEPSWISAHVVATCLVVSFLFASFGGGIVYLNATKHMKVAPVLVGYSTAFFTFLAIATFVFALFSAESDRFSFDRITTVFKGLSLIGTVIGLVVVWWALGRNEDRPEVAAAIYFGCTLLSFGVGIAGGYLRMKINEL